jgi:hypothetical protein
MLKNSGSLFVFVALTAVLAGTSASSASTLLNSGGWQITMATDATVDARAVVVVDPASTGDILVINIFKHFTQAAGQFGEMPSLLMNFKQVAPDAQTAGKIVINEETVYNDTGIAWTDFHWVLGQWGCASFNQGQTYPGSPQTDFSTAPFVNHTWVQTMPDANDPLTWSQQLNVFGGTLDANDSFGPGYTGALVIDVNKDFDGQAATGFFTLMETPTVPEPATLGLLAMGGLSMLLKRRR